MFQTNPRIPEEKHIKTYKNTRKHSTVASNKSSSVTVPSLRCKAQAAPVRPDTARGWKVRQQDAVREQKHYEILKTLSQNMAPNIRKFWKKEAELKPQPGVAQLLLFSGRDNKAASGTCGTADVCKMPRPKCGCQFGANVTRTVETEVKTAAQMAAVQLAKQTPRSTACYVLPSRPSSGSPCCRVGKICDLFLSLETQLKSHASRLSNSVVSLQQQKR